MSTTDAEVAARLGDWENTWGTLVFAVAGLLVFPVLLVAMGHWPPGRETAAVGSALGLVASVLAVVALFSARFWRLTESRWNIVLVVGAAMAVSAALHLSEPVTLVAGTVAYPLVAGGRYLLYRRYA
jgi:hypothetical protein